MDMETTTDRQAERPVRVAAVNDYEIIVEGVARLLARYHDRIAVCERILVGEPVTQPVDLALYDTYGRVGVAQQALEQLVQTPEIARVAVFSLDLTHDLIEQGRAAGATAFISKALSADQIADAVIRAARGEEVVAATPSRRPAVVELDWPGKADGLSERQSQVLVLVAEGLTNQQIAEALFLSQNTVKSYLKEIFARMHFRNRVDATSYVLRSGAFTRGHQAPPLGYSAR
jgi:DNA-binding NarL/FixJ family response regulator